MLYSENNEMVLFVKALEEKYKKLESESSQTISELHVRV